MDRVRCKPWGLDGGLSGYGNSVALHRYGKDQETLFHNGKALNQTLDNGDAYILRSGGGGGYGSPLDRDLPSLQRDVRCGYVSKQAAETVYGVVFVQDSAVINVEATKARRIEMRSKGLPEDQPVSEFVLPFASPSNPKGADEVLGELTQEERTAFAMTCRCCS
jgi:N-methylhydantoinase B